MSKVSDYFEKYIDENGDDIYRFRPLLRPIPPSPQYFIHDDPELEQVRIIEIPNTFSYLDKRTASNFPRLQKIIVLSLAMYDSQICFGDAAFQGCPYLREVHLHRPMCFINTSGNLKWKIPFCDSPNVEFIYYPEARLEDCSEEIKRWNIKSKSAAQTKQEVVENKSSLRRLHFNR